MLKLSLVLNIILLFISVSASERRRLHEDDMCKQGDTRWLCKRLSNCPTALQAIRAGEKPETCTFDGLEPIVCCPPSSPSHTYNSAPARPLKTKAQKKCQEYAKYVFRYEVRTPLLLDFPEERVKIDECGMPSKNFLPETIYAGPKEFPHMALIGYGERPKVKWLCSGSLISKQFILSAAHCAYINNEGPANCARLGDLDVSKDTDDDASAITVRIVERIKHPEFDFIRAYNDIALYKLEKPIDFNSNIRPICLDIGGGTYESPIVSGWEHSRDYESDTLQKVRVNMVDQNKCNQSYAGYIGKRLPHGIVNDYMICAGSDRSRDSCRFQGDSGAPLQVELKESYCMYSVIGVLTFSDACQRNVPGVHTRVSRYVPWIESVVWP